MGVQEPQPRGWGWSHGRDCQVEAGTPEVTQLLQQRIQRWGVGRKYVSFPPSLTPQSLPEAFHEKQTQSLLLLASSFAEVSPLGYREGRGRCGQCI